MATKIRTEDPSMQTQIGRRVESLGDEGEGTSTVSGTMNKDDDGKVFSARVGLVEGVDDVCWVFLGRDGVLTLGLEVCWPVQRFIVRHFLCGVGVSFFVESEEVGIEEDKGMCVWCVGEKHKRRS